VITCPLCHRRTPDVEMRHEPWCEPLLGHAGLGQKSTGSIRYEPTLPAPTDQRPYIAFALVRKDPTP
jgi:hypothetical protein